jgi:UDP-N-acetylglucosamine 1-carboxyvinyltransferase
MVRSVSVIQVTGGNRLVGRVPVIGAKNSVLKLMAAALLAPGKTTLTSVPGILDVSIMSELLRRLGCTVEHDLVNQTVVIDVPVELEHRADYDLVRQMRASICVLGPLVTRMGAADVAMPGGDAIGSRGLDFHISGLRKLGATIESDHGYLVAQASQRLHGASIWLEFPSVGATETILLAAVLAKGTTVIDNAAREPEIVDICNMLIAMGARVTGAGTSTIEIHGVDELKPVTHKTVPDRIVAGTWAVAATMTQGDVFIENAVASHLELPLSKLTDAGAHITALPDGIRVQMDQRPKAVDVMTLPFPGFPTDLQPQFIAMNAIAEGHAMVTENLFEARFRFVQELSRLGANTKTDGHHALILGVDHLSSAPVEATDIRAGAGLVLAGLVADGTTVVHGVEHIDRGYSNFVPQLQELGAKIERVD